MASYKLCLIIVILYILTLAQLGEMAPKKLRAQVKKSNGNVKLKATFKIAAPGPSKINKRNAKMGFYNGLSAPAPPPPAIGGFYSGPSAHMFLHSSPMTTTTYYPMRWGNILRRTDEFSPLPSPSTLLDNMNNFGSSSNLIDNVLPAAAGSSLWSSNDLPLMTMKSMPGNSKLNFLNNYNLNEPTREYNGPFGSLFNQYI
uniref:Uncharacterized protein n=1 Tax=Glossina brevipalpis TaxID=37001 RepID=A0A1A9WNM9_9MUSC